MKFRQYHMAADCPVCGDKDEKDAWRGARMGSTAWGHNFPCCSDKCGFQLAKLIKTWTPQKIAGLKRKMQNQASYRLF